MRWIWEKTHSVFVSNCRGSVTDNILGWLAEFCCDHISIKRVGLLCPYRSAFKANSMVGRRICNCVIGGLCADGFAANRTIHDVVFSVLAFGTHLRYVVWWRLFRSWRANVEMLALWANWRGQFGLPSHALCPWFCQHGVLPVAFISLSNCCLTACCTCFGMAWWSIEDCLAWYFTQRTNVIPARCSGSAERASVMTCKNIVTMIKATWVGTFPVARVCWHNCKLGKVTICRTFTAGCASLERWEFIWAVGCWTTIWFNDVAAAENMIMTLLDTQRLGKHYCTLHPAMLTPDAK